VLSFTRGLPRLIFACAVAAALALPAAASAAWQQPVRAALDADPAADARTPAAAVLDGVPYVAWSEGSGSSYDVRVARLSADGTAWTPVGGPLDRDGAGSWSIEPAIAAVGGTLYVAWAERRANTTTFPFQVHVSRLAADGTWQPAGDPPDTAEERSPSLAGFGGTPHLAYTSPDAQNIEVRVAALRDGAWTPVGGLVNHSSRAAAAAAGSPLSLVSPPPQEGGYEPDLAVVDGVLHVGWLEGPQTSPDVRVARLRDGAWAEYGDGASAVNAATGSSASDLDLAAIGRVPFAAWREPDGRNFEVRVARVGGGGAWEEVPGGASPVNRSPTANAAGPALLEAGGAAWLAWTERDGVNDELRVARLNASATAWEEPVGGASPVNHVATSDASDPVLLASGGIPWVTWAEGVAARDDVRVSRLAPDFLGTEVAAGATSATVATTLRAFGLAYPVRLAYGPAGAPPTASVHAGVAEGEQDTVTALLDGLAPRTSYEVRPLASAGAGAPVAGPATAFTTTKRNGKQDSNP
jgi:hypothetical protein